MEVNKPERFYTKYGVNLKALDNYGVEYKYEYDKKRGYVFIKIDEEMSCQHAMDDLKALNTFLRLEDTPTRDIKKFIFKRKDFSDEQLDLKSMKFLKRRVRIINDWGVDLSELANIMTTTYVANSNTMYCIVIENPHSEQAKSIAKKFNTYIGSHSMTLKEGNRTVLKFRSVKSFLDVAPSAQDAVNESKGVIHG